MKQVRKEALGGPIALLASLALLSGPGLAKASHTMINVATVAELEAAVQVPGAIVKVAPGTYELTQNITLAEGTQLIGSNKMRDTNWDGVPDPIAGPDDFVVAGTETKIVGNPAAPGGPGSVIIGGSGSNRVSNLTAVAGPESRTLVRKMREVSDCLLVGTPNATTGVRNDFCSAFINDACTGCEATTILRRTVIRDCQNGAAYANQGTTDARLKLFMSGNRFYRNTTGANLIGGIAASTSDLDIISIGNLTENNSGQGWFVTGGRFGQDVLPGNLNGSHGSRATVYSFKDVFRDNGHGVFGVASFDAPPSAVNTDNRVQITLLKAGLEQDPTPGLGPRADVTLWGELSPVGAPQGTNNVLEALILGSRVEVDPGFDLQLIDGGAAGSGNDVALIGSENTFTLLNDPFDVNTFGVEFCEFFTAGCPAP
jgi:hypothetical protein